MTEEEKFQEHKKSIFKRINSQRKEIERLRKENIKQKEKLVVCYQKWKEKVELMEECEDHAYRYKEILWALKIRRIK